VTGADRLRAVGRRGLALACSPAVIGVTGRLGVLGLLLLAALALPLPWWLGFMPLQSAPAVDLVLLEDVSLSARRWGAGERLAAVRAGLVGLPRGSRVAHVRFGAGAQLHQGFDGLVTAAAPPGGSRSDLSRAVHLALGLLQSGRRARLVIVSDGEAHGENPAAVLRATTGAGVGVDWLDLRGGTASAGVWLESLSAPRALPAPGTLRLRVDVGARGVTQALLQIFVGQRLASETPLDLRRERSVVSEVMLPRAGEHALRARVSAVGDALVDDDERALAVQVGTAAPVLWVGQDAASTLPRALAAGGWPVRRMRPAELAEALEATPSVVILDDVGVPDLAEAGQRALWSAVVERGAGMLVLGGPSSFGAGGYRGSQLERMLPVEVAPPRLSAPLTMLFLLDTSGSMGRDAGQGPPLARARAAVATIAAGLEPGDRIGVMGFDVTTRELLPLQPVPARGTPVAWSPGGLAALPSGAAGGTRLGPALDAALARLESDDAAIPPAQRLLFVISDGQWESGIDAESLARRVRAAGIEVVPVLLGTARRDALLARLAAVSDGAQLVPGAGDALPWVLRSEADRRRHVPVPGPLRPLSVAPLPFQDVSGPWPSLQAFAMTRAREDATVYLRAPGGAPLLASASVGAGRVAVLPGGLAQWAPQWSAWSQFPAVVAGLVSWLAPSAGDGSAFLAASAQPGGIRVQVYLADAAAALAPAEVRIDPPGRGASLRAMLAPAAPGLLETVVPVSEPGLYRIGAQLVGRSLQRTVNYGYDAEVDGSARQVLAPALAAGWLRALPDGASRLPATGVTAPWLLLALLSYLALLLLERWRRRGLSRPARGSPP
jgi:Mg-chelatase subunit ChlD